MAFWRRKRYLDMKRSCFVGSRGICSFLRLGVLLPICLVACSEKESDLPRGKYTYQYPTAGAEIGNYANNGDVEEGLMSWGVLGGASISRSNTVSHSGIYSVYIYGRTEPWHGLTYTFYPFSKGRTYNISVWARLAEGEEPAELRMTLRCRGGEPVYTRLDQKKVTDKEWVQLTGTFPHVEGTIEFVYVESESPTVGYHLDDMAILEAR